MSTGVGSKNEVSPFLLLAAGLCLGLGARGWVLSQTVFQSYAIDELFDTLALNLATHGFFSLDGTVPASHVGPLYPAILALFYSLVGHRPEGVPYLNMAMDVATAYCVFRGGSLLFGRTTGAIAAVVTFLYPAYWTYDVRIRNECLLTMLTAAWVWAAVACAKDTAVGRVAIMGMVGGLVALCKPVVLPAAGLLCIAIWLWSRSWQNAGIRLLVFATCFMMVVVPWTVRNYQQFQEFIPVSSGVGAGLWMGSDPVTRSSWPMSEADERRIWEDAGIAPLAYPHVMYEARYDRQLRTLGWARIGEHPWVYLTLTITRVFDFWIGNRYYLLNGETTLNEGLSKDIRERGVLVGFYSLGKRLLLIPGLLCLAVWGAWHFRADWKTCLPLYLVPLGVTIGYVPFTVESGRYALAVLPCILILVTAALVRVWGPGSTEESEYRVKSLFDHEGCMTTACSTHNVMSKSVEKSPSWCADRMPQATAIVVLADYAMLSWFGALAEWTGNVEAFYQVGTVLFLTLNVGLCLAWLSVSSNLGVSAVTQTGAHQPERSVFIVFGSLVTAALVYRVSAILRTPLDPAVADMLPVIMQASQFVLSGQDPYTTYHFVSHNTPMQWLPALWLPYVPGVWLGIDPRYLGLAAVLCCAVLVGFVKWKTSDSECSSLSDHSHPWVNLGLAGGLLLSPAAVWFGAIGHTQIYWLFLVWFVWCLHRRAWGWAGLSLGLCVMSRHTLLPLLPLVGLYLLRCLDLSAWRKVVCTTVLTVGILLLPFGMKGLRHLFVETPAYYWQLGAQAWTTTPWWVTHTFGLGVLLYPAGIGSFLSWVGGFCLVALYLLALRSMHDMRAFVVCFTLGLLIITVSVPTPFRYEFFPIVVLLSTIPLLPGRVVAPA